jgi:HD-GYP domain-containing protein (c-di-GMP phosphodiesterase class II)
MGVSETRHAALSRLAALVDAPPLFERISPAACAATRDLVEADGIWLCLRRRAHADLIMRHAIGIEPRSNVSRDVPIASDPLVETAVLAGRDMFVHDYPNAELSEPALRSQGVTSVVSAPIAAGTRELGALIAFRVGGRRFGEVEAALLGQAGQTLALVLATHEAQRDHARALGRERLLARAAEETSAAPALPVALHRTAEGAQAVADAAFAAVLVIDGDRMRIAAATPGVIRDQLATAVSGRLYEVPLRSIADVASRSSLLAGRPQLFVDLPGLLGRLGVTLPERSELHGRLAVVMPILSDGELAGGLLIVLEAASPDPAVFGSLETLAAQTSGVLRRARLHGEVERAYLSTVTALANALEAKHQHTHEHASETARTALAVGHRLGLSTADLRDLQFAAVLHDVGKIAIPDEILNREGPLTPEEWRFVQDHTIIGERILRGIPFLESAAAAVRSAHERWDGRGYPDGLSGEDIPLLSRIVFACDTWDVMTSDRPYRAALDRNEALRRLREGAGTQLDPAVVEALLGVLAADTPQGTRRAARPRAA